MKNVRILALMVCMGMMVFLPNAQAASLSVSPNGPFDVTGLSSVTFDVFFNTGAAESFSIAGAGLDFLYDTTELNNFVATNLAPTATVSELTVGALDYLFFSFGPGTDLNFGPGSSNRLASLTFNVIDPAQAFDGLADFSVASQIGDPVNVFLLATGDTIQLDGAAGADVGVNAVPIPGAIWLLGSGLVGMVGLKRRRKS